MLCLLWLGGGLPGKLRRHRETLENAMSFIRKLLSMYRQEGPQPCRGRFSPLVSDDRSN